MPRLTKLSRSIKGKIALVTGAASGMGQATAYLFADEEATVAVLDRNAEGVTRVVEEIKQAGGNATGWTLDLSNSEDIEPTVTQIAEHFGGLDILINNAGIDASARIQSSKYEEVWERWLPSPVTQSRPPFREMRAQEAESDCGIPCRQQQASVDQRQGRHTQTVFQT